MLQSSAHSFSDAVAPWTWGLLCRSWRHSLGHRRNLIPSKLHTHANLSHQKAKCDMGKGGRGAAWQLPGLT